MNPLNQLIQEKFINKNKFCVYHSIYDTLDKPFRFSEHIQSNNVNVKFLEEIESIWRKPIDDKNLFFSMPEMNVFKKELIHSFLKKESLINFENAFHSFFKNFGMKDLFDIICLDSHKFKTKPNPYQRHTLFLLNQDYVKHKDFHPFDFLNILNINFNISPNKYIELKESLFVYLSTHYNSAKKKYIEHYSTKNQNEIIRQFDLRIYESIKKNINENDLPIYQSFWENITIKVKNDKLISLPKERFFPFDINYSFLQENYPSIKNSEYAKKANEFTLNFINNNFNELKLTHIKDDESSYQFVCSFNQKLTNDNLFVIINKTLDVFESCKMAENYILKNEYSEIYNEKINDIKHFISYSLLENDLYENNQPIIKKLKI